LRAAGANQTRKTENLTGAERQVHLPVRIRRGLYVDEVDYGVSRRNGRFRVKRFEVPPDHQANHRVMFDRPPIEMTGDPPIAKHDDPIGALLDLVQTMRDEDDGDAAGF